LVPSRKCSGCGGAVTQKAIDSGRALTDGSVVYCEECTMLIREPEADDAGDDIFPEPDSASPTDATVELSIERLRRKLQKRRKKKLDQQMSSAGKRSKSGTVAVIIGALIVAFILILVLVLRK